MFRVPIWVISTNAITTGVTSIFPGETSYLPLAVSMVRCVYFVRSLLMYLMVLSRIVCTLIVVY